VRLHGGRALPAPRRRPGGPRAGCARPVQRATATSAGPGGVVR
jgi:hypothetical protein